MLQHLDEHCTTQQQHNTNGIQIRICSPPLKKLGLEHKVSSADTNLCYLILMQALFLESFTTNTALVWSLVWSDFFLKIHQHCVPPAKLFEAVELRLRKNE